MEGERSGGKTDVKNERNIDDLEARDQARAEPQGQHDMSHRVWVLVVTAVLFAVLLFALDNTIVTVVQPKIIYDLGHIDRLPWISVAYAACNFSTILLWAKSYGLFNTKALFITAVILFNIGSAVCGSAQTMSALIFGRAICGVGGGGIYIGTMTTLSVFTRMAKRPLVLSFIACTWGLGVVLGPVVGGVLADSSSATWRWAFYVNLCIGALTIPIYVFFMPSYRPTRGHLAQLLARIDWAGAVLFAGAAVSLVMGISFGGVVYPWSSSRIIGLLTGSAAMWTAFASQQAFSICVTPEDRLFPVSLIQSTQMNILFVHTAASNTIAFVPIFFLPLLFQFARSTSALQAGVYLLPYIAFFVTTILANGALMDKAGAYMLWYLAGGVLSVAGAAPLTQVTPATEAAQIYGLSILIALGAGAYTQASFSVAQAKVPPSHVHDAIAFVMCAEFGGLSVTLAVANAIFLNQAQSMVGSLLPNAKLSEVQMLVSGAGTAIYEGLDARAKADVLQVLTTAIDHVYYMVVAAGAVTLALSLAMKRERLFT